ncbi:MAG: hypothetical protein ACM3ZA_07225 [Bacillota bacterium]
MRSKLARVALGAVLLVLWHLILSWLARQVMPGTTSRLSVVPYVGVSLVYLLGVGWVARHVTSEGEEEKPNRVQALVAMFLAQVAVQGFDWLTMNPPGDLSLMLLSLPLAGVRPLVLALQMLLPQGAGVVLDRLAVIFVPWLVTYWSPSDEDTDTRATKGARRTAR